MLLTPLFIKAALLCAACPATAFRASRADEVQWEPVSEYDGEKFPSLIISTAALRPDLNEEEEPDPCLPGDPFGLLGISTSFPGEGTEIKLTIKENEVFGESVWKGTLEEEAGYWIAPTVNWKHRSPAPR